MSRTFVYADPHFGHSGVCKFLGRTGEKLRPWDDVYKMNEDMIKWYNEVVNDEDRVYILGDVAMNRKGLDSSLHRLKGRKVLVKGNHDQDKLSYYSKFFDDIRAYVVKKGFIMSHIPIHPGSLSRWDINIHGHLHDGSVHYEDKYDQPDVYKDNRYVCVSVEHTNFRPILLDNILKNAGLKP